MTDNWDIFNKALSILEDVPGETLLERVAKLKSWYVELQSLVPAQGAVNHEEASEMSALADEYAKGLQKLIECGYEEYGPVVQRKHSLTIRALRFTASSLPSTGLPAPAPHAEVRETFVINNPDGSISLDAYAGMSRAALKERCGELCRALSEWQFVAVTAATDGANTIENVREPYRSKVAQIIEAYSDETDAPQQEEGRK